MLAEAKRLAERGVDVVVGLVETHERADTETMLAALEQIPLSHIFQRGELGQQIMKLPDKPELATAEFCCIFLGELSQIELGEVYVTLRSPIKHSEDVQEGTLSGT